MVIEGTGAMKFFSTMNVPWYYYRSGIKTITIAAPVTTIGSYAFISCTVLTSVSIPSSVTNIDSDPFYECTALTAINVDAANPRYSSSDGILFTKNRDTIWRYPEGKTATSYTIPSSVSTIGMNAFTHCVNLTSVSIPNSVITIGQSAFNICSALTSVTIPSSVTSIRFGAFDRCSALSSVIIPNSLTKISAYTFYGTALYSVSIPSSVTVIEYSAFENCTALTSVYNYATTPQSMNTDNRNTDVFKGITLSNVSLYVPAASVAAYQAAYVWKDFKSIRAISSGGGGDGGGTAVAADALPKLAIYPNPAGDMLYITDEFAGVVEIYDLVGVLVLTAASNAINISSLLSGIYVVKAGGKAAKVVKR